MPAKKAEERVRLNIIGKKEMIKSPEVARLFGRRLAALDMTKSAANRAVIAFQRDHRESESNPKHLFKIWNGRVFIGDGETGNKSLIPTIAKVLKLEEQQIRDARLQDKSMYKYDRRPAVRDLNERVKEIVRIVEGLTDAQQVEILEYIRSKSGF